MGDYTFFAPPWRLSGPGGPGTGEIVKLAKVFLKKLKKIDKPCNIRL
jgi:hypothetical protein